MVVVCQRPQRGCGVQNPLAWGPAAQPGHVGLGPDSSRKISRAGSKPACCRRQRRRARTMSGRSCSLARSVFFYMSGPSSPRPRGWLAGSSRSPAAWRSSARVRSGLLRQQGAELAAMQWPQSWACARRSDGAGRGRRCGGAAGGAF